MTHPITEKIVSRLRDIVVDPEVEKKIDGIPNRLSESGYDAWGFSPEYAKWSLSVFKILYEKWFRVETFGIENIPKKGRLLLVGNHSGQLPLDGVMVGAALALEAKPPRAIRALIEKWFPTLPVISEFMARCGQVVGTPANCVKLLENDEVILVFPEGVSGSGKLVWNRYHLQKFGYGFMRLALKTGTPILPVAIIGGEETYPALYNWKLIARLAAFPYFPVTPTFPFLGPLGLIPFPAKFRIFFDEPILFEGDPDAPDAVLQEKVDIVRSAIQKMIHFGLETRTGIFR
jgi:1-acyl-sn-glycerol-3-phosphate acyltransferase